MLLFNLNDFVLKINLDKDGLYVFRGKSATGKSYLKVLLDALKEQGKSVITITYRYNEPESYYIDMLQRDADLYFIDRADLWLSESIVKEICSVAEHKLVLMDCKAVNIFMDMVRTNKIKLSKRGYADIQFSNEQMEVYDGSLNI